MNKGFDVISKLAKLGCKAGEVNPKLAAHLWKTVALPHILYGCELWYLKNQHIKGLERVLNVFCRVTQGLIPGSSGSAARGLLGLHSIKAEIGKRKLYLLGRIINSSSSLAYRKLFIRKLIKWKWRQSNSTMSGFIPDIIKLLVDVNLLGYVTEFLRNDKFPVKIIWKKIVKKAVYESDHYEWVDKIERKKELELYLWSQPCISLSIWYDLWKCGQSKQIIDILRLLCGSLTVNKDRFGNPGTLNGICSACQGLYNNAVHHAILYCRKTEEVRESWWSWIQDHLPVTTCMNLHSLDDQNFIRTLLGDYSVLSGCRSNDSFSDDFKLRCAMYISYCVQNSVFDPFVIR